MHASAMAGAVLRASGSTTMFFGDNFGSAFFTSATCFAPHTTLVRAGVDSPVMRFIVSAISGSFEVSGKNCFGRELRERGQNRVPLPPAMITA
jgi:hypothetical protein